MNLYITADAIGSETGGGKVTYHESKAFREFDPDGKCEVFGKDWFEKTRSGDNSVWYEDNLLHGCISYGVPNYKIPCWEKSPTLSQKIPRLAHFYAGSFSKTVSTLKEKGCKITYTAAAHDVDLSRREHRRLGIPFDYPHLTDPAQWGRYLQGYLDADILVCPSQHSANVMRKFGRKDPIVIIPHGVDIPDKPVAPLPEKFTVGYLGAIGPDKGLIYLLQAWKKLNYKDSLLVLAGQHSTSPFMYSMIERFGGGNICLMGWVKDIADFYNSISCYCQPSVTEGFGIEVLEAMAYGRAVIASTGCGASDVLIADNKFAPANVDAICAIIESVKGHKGNLDEAGGIIRELSREYTWDKILARYVEMWKGLL